MRKTKVKICGIKTEQDIEIINEVKPDYAGFIVLFPKSKRNISLEEAAYACARIDSDIKKVAVTVAPSLEDVRAIIKAGFKIVQIHGELPEGLENEPIDVIKAFNVKDLGEFESCANKDFIRGYVFDAARPGSGETFDWNLLSSIPKDGKLFILAGGLNSENVAEAIRFANPDVVDVSSAVEYAPNIIGKDPDKVRSFVKAVRDLD